MSDDQADLRAHMLARIADEHAAWRAVVAEVGRDRMLEPGPMGAWSFRDLAVHLLGWRERSIARIEAGAAGRVVPADPWPSTLGDPDEINDWINDQSRDLGVGDVLQAVDRSFERLASALAAFPEDRLSDPNAIPGFEGYAPASTDWLSHWHEEHEADVRDWLARRPRTGSSGPGAG